MKIRYVVYPGHVRSRTDGDLHFVNAQRLMRLYGVHLSECVVATLDGLPTSLRLQRERYYDTLIALRPRADGNYQLLTETVNVQHNNESSTKEETVNKVT